MRILRSTAAAALVASTLALLGSVVPAAATPILLTLTSVSDHSVGPQSNSNPCVICGNAQNPAGFGYNNYKESGSISSYNMWSTTPTAQVADGVQGTPYTVGQIEGVLNNSPFVVAIDVNTTSAAGETLELFEIWDMTSNTVLYYYNGPTVIGGVSNNGNGYADWTLGNVDLSNLASTDKILFHAVWDNASDGAESFFLVPTTTTQVPEPLTLSLFGAGLAGAAVIRRRKAKKA